MVRKPKHDKPVLKLEASKALEEAKEPFFKIELAIDRLDEEDLVSFIAETRRQAAEGSHMELLHGLIEYASAQLAIIQARRSTEGVWFACLEVIRWDPAQRSGIGIASYSEKCEGRDTAVIAARRLLVEHAGQMSDDTTVDARIETELEWLADQRGKVDGDFGLGPEIEHWTNGPMGILNGAARVLQNYPPNTPVTSSR